MRNVKPDMSMIGKRYGKLVVVKFSHKANNEFHWECKCDCGGSIVKSTGRLNSKYKAIQGCHCMEKERRDKLGKFGYLFKEKNNLPYKDEIMDRYRKAISRCYNKNNIMYPVYGGRGIAMCSEWLSDKMKFYDWAIKNGFDPKLSLDRIDNNGNYEPSNCRWATIHTQMNNTSYNVYITYNGISGTWSQWGKIYGLNPNTIRRRVERGWPIDERLFTK